MCGRKKYGVSKRNNTAKDLIHALTTTSSLLLFESSSAMSKSKKRREMEKQCGGRKTMMQVTMTHNKTEGSKAFRAASERKQQTTIDSTTYLPCGERQPLNAVVDPPNPPSSSFSKMQKLSKMEK
jgi:hypothetical protein